MSRIYGSVKSEPRLDVVAERLSELLCKSLNSDDAMELTGLMQEWSEGWSTSYKNLMRVPGFRKLWDAIEMGAHDAVAREFEADRAAAAEAEVENNARLAREAC